MLSVKLTKTWGGGGLGGSVSNSMVGFYAWFISQLFSEK